MDTRILNSIRGTVIATLAISMSACRPPTVTLKPSVKLRGILVNCEVSQIPADVYFPCEAIGIYSDGTRMNVTHLANWGTSDSSVMSFVMSMGGRMRGNIPGVADISASLDGISGTVPVTITSATPVSLVVAPQDKILNVGTHHSYSSICIFSDNSYFDVTHSADWSSDNPAVAEVSANILEGASVEARATGKTRIRATFEGIQGSAEVSVLEKTLLAIQVSPDGDHVVQGFTRAYSATGIFTDLSTVNLTAEVSWSVVDGAIASISNAAGNKGLMTAFQVGTTQITATYGGFSDSADVTITNPTLSTISILPNNPSVARGLTQQLLAMGHFSDGSVENLTENVTWSSLDGTIMSVSNAAGEKGEVSANNLGSTTISATLGAVSGQTTGTVTAPMLASITVSPLSPSIAKGLTVQYTATGNYSDGSSVDITASVTWSSNALGIAQINTVGLAQGMGVGSTIISASLSGRMGQAQITVTPAELVSIAVTPANSVIHLLQSLQFTATGTYTDGSTQNLTSSVTWASSNGLAASISNSAGNQGRATGTGLGTTTISATATGGIVGSTQLTGTL